MAGNDISYIIPKSAIDGIRETDKAIISFDNNLLKVVQTIASVSEKLKEQGISFQTLNALQKQSEINTKALTDEEKKLEQIKKSSAANTDKVVKARIEAQRKTKEQKEAITELVQAEQGELGTLQKLANENKKLTAERKTLNLETQKGKDRLKEINSQLDKNNKTIRENSDSLGKQKINIGNYSSALGNLGGVFGNLVRSVQAFGRSLMTLLANPIVAIVAAIVAVFTGLVAVFKSTDEGGTKLDALFASLSSILDVLKRRASILIDAFAALFSGEFQRAGELFSETVTGIGEELQKTAQAAWDYTIALDAIKDRNIAFISENAKVRLEIEKNLSLSKDQTKADKERLDALNRAIALEESLSNKKIELANATYENELNNAAAKANIDKETLRVFIQLNEDQQTAARENSKILAGAWNILGDDIVETLENAYAKTIEAETEYFQKTRRAISLRSGLINKSEKQNVETRRKAGGEILEMEAVTIDAQIALQNNLAEETIAIAKLTEEKMQRLRDGELEQVKRLEDEKARIRQEKEDERVNIAQNAISSLSAIGDTFFQIQNQQRQEESAAIARQKEYELRLAGDNQEKINAINQKYAKKEAELKTKQAKDSKKQALFNAIINLASGIVAMFQAGPAGLVLAALTTALGAVQIATIASQPIPQFFTGTESAPGGLISVGEKGRELIQSKSGDLFLANKPTITSGLEGAKIWNNRETERIMSGGYNIGFDSGDLKQTLNENNRQLIKTISNKKEFHYSAIKRELSERSNGYVKTIKNVYFG